MVKAVKKLCLILAAALLFSLFGCSPELIDTESGSSGSVSGQTASNDEQTDHSLSLPYDSKDSLDPFQAKTLVNTILTPVMYDGLVRLNDKFETEPVIAEKITVSGTQITVLLRNDVLFSDGSKVTAEDVTASFQKAKAAPRYQAQLANFRSVQILKEPKNAVLFTLNTQDPLCQNLLDFPIVKKDSPKEGLPIGSGRYTAMFTEGTAKLVYHQKHFRKAKPAQTEIPLKSMPDNEAMLSGIKTGTMSAVFSDLSSGELSSAGALSETVTLNNLVYLGINGTRSFVSQPTVRQAIAYAIDKGTIFYNGFSGRGVLAGFPMHPLVSSKLEIPAELQLSHDLAEANRLLDGAGFKEKNVAGYRLSEGSPITLELLVCSDSNFKKLASTLLKEMFAAAGIQLNVKEQNFAAYQESIRKGEYDLYIGEMKLLNNMDLTALLEDDAVLAGTTETLRAAYRSYRDDGTKYEDFIRQFNQEMPFVPLLFRSGVLIYNRNIKTKIVTSVTDVYYNLEEWV